MGWACSAHREMRNVYKILVGKPKGKRPLGPQISCVFSVLFNNTEDAANLPVNH
jgi:hypothetical protein